MPDQSQKVIQKPESDPVKQREPGKKSLRAQKTNWAYFKPGPSIWRKMLHSPENIINPLMIFNISNLYNVTQL